MAATRFATSLAVAAAGAALAAFTFAFAIPTVAWLSFGIAGAVVALALAGFATSGVGPVARWLDAALVIMGAWTMLAVRVFGPAVLIRWCSFAGAATFAGLGVIGLVAHEILLERDLRAALEAARGAALVARAPVAGAPRRAGNGAVAYGTSQDPAFVPASH